MVEFNADGGLEISPGPRGHSITGFRLSPDGTVVYFQTDKPSELNGIPLPIGPRGPQGIIGDPGESRIRVDETVGFRLFLWDTSLAGEYMAYGDTGTWTLVDGTTTVRRSGNEVETNAADPTTLPAGFRPAVTGSTGHYLTDEEWPTEVTGTITTPPVDHLGLVGYQAAVAQGYPGTAEEWMNMVYRVVLPPAGSTGQVLTRTEEGSEWRDAPYYGPGTWDTISLEPTWEPVEGSVAQVRNSSGTVELIGLLRYVGPTVTAGSFAAEFVRIGAMPPAYAPAHPFDLPITTYRSTDNEATFCRLIVGSTGVIHIGAATFASGPAQFTLKGGVAEANLSAVSYALRNS